jgi:two-component system chemotaxis response regulator CheY
MKKVMIVDDSLTIRQTVGYTLKNAGYDIVEASNGVEALDVMKKNEIGLFICDVNMPEMDGITFLKKVKQDNTYKYTPIIMLTTEAGKDRINEGREAGAKAWMVKPFVPEQLLEAVKKLMIVR